MNHTINQALIDKVQLKHDHQPLACFLIGANGSGKSTLRNYLNLSEIQTNIDPYALNRIAQLKHTQHHQANSARQAINLYTHAIENNLNVCMESTLAGKGTIKRIKKAKANGYYSLGYFIGINDVSINIERVRMRVQKGGHDIPENLIHKRYRESIDNLLTIYQNFDELHILDNSNTYYQLQTSIYQGQLIYHTNLIESWVQDLINAIQAKPSHKNRKA
jgi:predicted ABC-type ATPase